MLQGAFEVLTCGKPYAVEQLERVRALADLPSLTIRVIPYSAGAFPGIEAGDHALLEFENAYPVARYTSLLGNVFVHDIEEVDAIADAFDRLGEVALSPADSLAFIEERRVAT